MHDKIKGLLAKVWKDEDADLQPGRHFFDETLIVRVRGSVEKANDQHVTPTVSVPLVTTLALFWEKCGVDRDQALKLLREAITEAMELGENEDARCRSRRKSVPLSWRDVVWPAKCRSRASGPRWEAELGCS